uniref:Uncharacterized protein n=1 Tax=Coccolithus braarudii TaxID=221442 RepID=A0A7S0LTK5_9EUKA|mmetsp:Transcript_9939/g.21577  ORF Transcript_9939/g.21577 Transcript_9939/m.21577 type:complete len:309 (+) Transcript_9939:43-969(+)
MFAPMALHVLALLPGSPPSRSGFRMRSSVLMTSTESAAAALSSTQASALDNVVSVLSLEEKDYPSEVGFDSFTLGGAGAGNVRAFDAPGKTNVAWCSKLDFVSTDQSLSRITAWCGPLTDVPHLVVSTGVSGGGIDLSIDFRPRADAGYELRQPDGTYPEPTSREAFMQGSTRVEYSKAFFTEEATAWAAAVCAAEGAVVHPPSTDGRLIALQGPLMLNLRLPLSDNGVNVASHACASAVARWVEWMQTTDELNRLKVTSTYARDTKLRATLFGIDSEALTARFGEEGRSLAAADAGPLDEAYVGGAS